MWNLLNRKWVPIVSLVLSILMLITSIFIYISDLGRNILKYCDLSNTQINVLCGSLSILSLIIFISTINVLLIKKYFAMHIHSFNNNTDTHNHNYSLPTSLEDIEINYSFNERLLLVRYDNYNLPISIEALRQIIELNNYVHNEDMPDVINFFNALTSNDNKDINLDFEARIKYNSKKYQNYRIKSTYISSDNDTSPKLSISINPATNSIYSADNNLNQRDSLTSLYDFSSFRQLVTATLSNNRPLNKHNYILIIDIANYQVIHDKFGSDFADILQICFSNQLSRILASEDLTSYVYDNKFIVFLNNDQSIKNVDNICHCIKNIFASMSLTDDIPSITCNINVISIANESDVTCDELLYNADIDLTKIKPLFNLPLLDSSKLIYGVVSIFNDSKNLVMSLNTTLNLIGYIFNLDMISLYELNERDNSIETDFTWYSDNFIKHSSKITKVTVPNYENFILYKDSYSNIFSTDSFDNLELDASAFKYALEDANCKCLYQKKITKNNSFNGFLLAASSTNNPDWNNTISDALTLLTAIISSNLEKLRTQQSIQNMIKLDNLTGAYNLKSFSNIVANLFTSYSDKRFAMIYFDIDRFTLLNERNGYATGDYILKKISNALEDTLMKHEAFCRIVDDKFVVFAEYSNLENIKHRMQKFQDRVHVQTDEQNNKLKINLTAGLSLVTNKNNISQVIDEANTARRSVKHRHNTNYAFYNEAMRNQQLKAKSLEDVMEDALHNDEFCLYLQPKYNVIEQRVCGAEALVRWIRPGYGIVPPNEFIPIFEENSFIIEIDYYIFDKVCELIRKLLDEGREPVPISVNFSRLHLNNTKILDKLKYNLEKYNLTPEYIEIEITESALAESDVYMSSILNEIHRLGFKLAMDDFGTGMSSLNSLRKLPFDILKLDKDFFQKDQITKRERIVISNIVRLGKELAMSIVSEGVETVEQINFLKDIQCPVIQGFYFSKPIHYNEFLTKYL